MTFFYTIFIEENSRELNNMNVRTEKCTQVAISFVWLTVSLLCLPSILLHGLVPAGTSDTNQEKVIQSFIWKYLLEELKTLTSDNDDAPAIFLNSFIQTNKNNFN